MDTMLEKISQSLTETHGIVFDPEHYRVRCLAHVINLSARKLIDSLFVNVQYEDETSFEEVEDNEEYMRDAVFKVLYCRIKI